MPTLYESKCCREYRYLLNDKLEEIKCITDNKDFEILCLNKTILDTAFSSIQQTSEKV